MFTSSPYAWLSRYFSGFYFSYGVYLPFWALWFKEQGISDVDIGLLLGIALATRCFANLVITPRIHQVEQLLPAIRYLTLGCTLFIGVHFFIVGASFGVMVAVTVLFNLCFGPITPLADSVTNYYARLKMLDYGRTRLWGSLAFIAGSTVVGFLVARYGVSMILYSALVGMSVSLICSIVNPQPIPESNAQDKGKDRPKLSQLLREWSVIRFLLLVALIQGSHAAYYGFSSIYWKSVGHSEEIIGYLWSLGVVAEVAVFASSKYWVDRCSLQTLFSFAAMSVMIRWGIIASTANLGFLIMAQLLHGVTFAIAHIAAILYIQRSDINRMVALQSLYNALPLGAFIAMMTALSGWGYQLWGANLFWIMASMGLLALLVKIEKP